MIDWVESDDVLAGMLILDNFQQGVEIVNKIAPLAEELNHHPDIFLTYNMLSITLSTHDEGDIVTDKDRTLAERISACLKERWL